nr:hypothetical protein Iba_scaffold332CG0010 [Ipomoea batatas]
MVLRLYAVTEREDPPRSPVAPHRPAIATLAAESEEGAPSRLSARRLEGSHRLSRPTAASPPGVRRRWRLQPLSLRHMSPEAGERRTAAAGVHHRRWKTGDDGGRSCYVLAGCSSLPPATCFVDVVAVRRRRRITATTDALGVSEGSLPALRLVAARRRAFITDSPSPPQSSAMVLRLHAVTEREDPPRSPVAPHRPAIATLAAESEEGAPSRLSARRLEGSHRLSRPTAASPPGVRRRWRLQPLSLRRMSPEAGERRTAAAGVRHRRWKTGDDGGRSCYVLAGCSSLPPATCFVDVVAVRRRRRITATTDALGVSLSAAHYHRLP